MLVAPRPPISGSPNLLNHLCGDAAHCGIDLNTKSPELRFCALLTGSTREVRFERVAAG
jgi:hypothetical protein